MDDNENEQNIDQDVIKEYINYNHLISSTTNKNMKYDSIKKTVQVGNINKIIVLNIAYNIYNNII